MNVPALAAVPFTFKRSSDQYAADGTYSSTAETAHGLLRLEADRLVVQWRLAVHTELMKGSGYEVREDIEPVREIFIPLAAVADAVVTERRWWRLAAPKLIITGSDLAAFEEIAGEQGLKLKHPSRLALRIRRGDRLLAEEFAAELALARARLPSPDGERAAAALPPDGAAAAIPPGPGPPDRRRD